MTLEEKIHALCNKRMMVGIATSRIFVAKWTYFELEQELRKKEKYDCNCCFCKSERKKTLETPQKIVMNTVSGPVDIVELKEGDVVADGVTLE